MKPDRMTTSEVIDACSTKTGLPFLVIGGHAIIAHGYTRNTIDLDLLTRKRDRDEWIKALSSFGYEVFHLHENFAQFTPLAQNIPVDLMFVNEATFDGLFAASQSVSFGAVTARVPSLEHLLALKLHVLRQALPQRMLGDMDDVINLVLANGLDLRSDKWKQLFQKYGTLDLYEKVLHATRP